MDSVNNTALVEERNPIDVQIHSPWLQMNGEITPNEFLKTLTPFWEMKMWEKYLSWLDNREVGITESLLIPHNFALACDSAQESIFENSESGADEALSNHVSDYLECLTPQQKRVIKLIFWEGRSERYVAEKMGIKQPTVNGIKRRAYKKLRKFIHRSYRLPSMRDGISSHKKGSANEENFLSPECDSAEFF